MDLIFREAILSDIDEIVKVRKEGIDNGFWTYTRSDVYTNQMLSDLKEDFEQETFIF